MLGRYIIIIMFPVMILSSIVTAILKKTGKNEIALKIEKVTNKFLFTIALLLISLAVIVVVLKLFDITFLETLLKPYFIGEG